MKTPNTNNGMTLFPMSMLSTIVGDATKVAKESANYSFLYEDEYFHYEEGEILESINAIDVPFLLTEGFVMYENV